MSNIDQRAKLYRTRRQAIGDYCRESYPLFRALRHRTPSYPIYLPRVIHKPFTLSRVFLLSSGGKSIVLVKKTVPSRSGFLRSMHVVLKTRYVNPNIHVRRFIVHVRSPNFLPLVHNFYPYTEQQPDIGSLIGQYRFTPHTSTHSLHIPLLVHTLRLHQRVVPIATPCIYPS